MTTRSQIERFYNTGDAPASLLPGSLFVNFPDLKLGIQGTSAPIDLLPLRIFSDQANYVAGDLVYHNGSILKAASSIVAGPFDIADWIDITTDPFVSVGGSVNWDVSVTYNSDNLVEQTVYSRGSFFYRITITYNVDNFVGTVLYESSVDSGLNYDPVGTATYAYDTEDFVSAITWS